MCNNVTFVFSLPFGERKKVIEVIEILHSVTREWVSLRILCIGILRIQKEKRENEKNRTILFLNYTNQPATHICSAKGHLTLLYNVFFFLFLRELKKKSVNHKYILSFFSLCEHRILKLFKFLGWEKAWRREEKRTIV